MPKVKLPALPYEVAPKFITDDAKSINLTLRITRNDENYTILSAFDDIHSKLNIASNRKYHPLVSEQDGEYYLKFKLYLNTLLFDKDKTRLASLRYSTFTNI